jgi:Domain of unknown function (DUF4288)
MADSPETPRWYIAELVEELILGRSVRNVIHRKTRVIFADSENDAYEKAISLSSEHEGTYLNQTHNNSQTRFWGLSELNLLKEEKDSSAAKPSVIPHFRKSDHLTPAQIVALMSMQGQALPQA